MAKHAPAETRRAQVLDAAMACFSEHGYHETSIDDIAAHAGLSKGAIYHHFAGKRDILIGLFEVWSEQLLQRWEAIGRESDPLEALSRDADATFASVEDLLPLSRGAVELLSHAAHDDQMRGRVAALYSASRARISALLSDAQRRGLIGDIDPEGVATALMAMFEGLFVMKAMDPDGVDVAAVWKHGVTAILDGLVATRKEGAPS
ncbi:MAG TPA: TetR/AcrR family transcriptional regulator [Dehalococcoidia bacterium]